MPSDAAYGSMSDEGRLSSKYPQPFVLTNGGILMVVNSLFATSAVKSSSLGCQWPLTFNNLSLFCSFGVGSYNFSKGSWSDLDKTLIACLMNLKLNQIKEIWLMCIKCIHSGFYRIYDKIHSKKSLYSFGKWYVNPSYYSEHHFTFLSILDIVQELLSLLLVKEWLSLWLPNEIRGHLTFAPFLIIIMAPKRS